jgi:hypothetical protein
LDKIHRRPHCKFEGASEGGLKQHITKQHPIVHPEPSTPNTEEGDPGPTREPEKQENPLTPEQQFREILLNVELNSRGNIPGFAFSKVCRPFAVKLGTQQYLEALGCDDSTDVPEDKREETLKRLIQAASVLPV